VEQQRQVGKFFARRRSLLHAESDPVYDFNSDFCLAALFAVGCEEDFQV